MRHWLEQTPEALASYMKEAGQPAFRARQLSEWLHSKRAANWETMKNLPAALRGKLAADGTLRALCELERRDAGDALTSKWLFSAGGNDYVESVLIIEKHHSRRTVCVSCMVGCPLACAFCATGQGGFGRNLSAGEIVEQVYGIDAFVRPIEGEGVSHVVFMGMGEPLLNLPAVLAAADRFAHPEGLGLSGRHLTISTAGIPEGIRALAASGRNYRLALSLHASNQKTREKLMPIAKRHPLPEVFAALEEFAKVSSRDVTFEYCLIDGINDSPADARELAGLVRPFGGRVNLIPMNGVSGAGFRAPSAGAVRRFQEELEKRGASAPVRMEKGAEIGAACGQLRAERRKTGT